MLISPHHLRMINPDTLYNPQSFGYSHIVEVRQFRRIIHIAGQGGENLGGELTADFAQQVKQAFRNVQIALDCVGAKLQDIAMLRVLIVGHNEIKHHILIEIMQQFWSEQKFPACTLIPISQLAKSEMLFEVEATAYLD